MIETKEMEKMSASLFVEIREMVEATRRNLAQSINAELTMLNWRIGKRISEGVLEGERAEYGKQIVVSLIRQLSWTHFLALIPLKDRLQREFYAEMCRLERWSVRTLRAKIDSMLYERTGISRKPAELALSGYIHRSIMCYN